MEATCLGTYLGNCAGGAGHRILPFTPPKTRRDPSEALLSFHPSCGLRFFLTSDHCGECGSSSSLARWFSQPIARRDT